MSTTVVYGDMVNSDIPRICGACVPAQARVGLHFQRGCEWRTVRIR
jgi:hypothetical protein